MKGCLFVKVPTIEEANILDADPKFRTQYRLNDRLSSVYGCVVFQRRVKQQ